MYKIHQRLYRLSLFLLATAFQGSVLAASYPSSALSCYQLTASEEYAAAFVHCQASAATGDPESQFKLATLYAQGHGVTKDFSQAVVWLESASNQGHIEATYNLGFAYHQGNGVTFDLERAAAIYRVSALKGHTISMRNLASFYENGTGLEQDQSKAFHWYQKTADADLSFGQLKIGIMLLEGVGTDKDPDAGMEWIKKSATAGEADAQFVLGLLLRNQHPIDSITWFKKAVAQNHVLAMHHVADLLRTRAINKVDFEQAAFYADLAVRSGNVDSVVLAEQIHAEMNSTQDPSSPLLALPSAMDKLPVFDQEQMPASTRLTDSAPTQPVDPEPGERYTIQLISLSTEQRVQSFIERFELQDHAHYYAKMSDDTEVFVVTYGQYDALEQARSELSHLPTALKKLKPMVKKLPSLQLSYR